MTPTAALFDIDGTLVDSNYLHVEAWSIAFAKLDVAIDTWRSHRGIGMDSGKLLEALLGDDEDGVGDRAKDLHSSEYETLTSRLRAFHRAQELLRTLVERGVRVVLATSAPDNELEILRGVLDVDDILHATTSSSDVETAKPEPDVVTVALEKAGVAASDAVFIGDSVWDMIAATRAGVAPVGVLSGGYSAAELRDAGTVEVYDDVADLLEKLQQSALAALDR